MSKELTGISWIIFSGFLFVVVTGLVRHVGTDLPALQAAFIRYVIGFIFLLPFILRRFYINNKSTAHQQAQLILQPPDAASPTSSTQAKPIASTDSQTVDEKKPAPLILLYAARGAVHAIGVFLWFYAMARLPVALVTAIGFLTPVCVTVGAVIFLNEKIKLRRSLGVVISLMGGLIILAPELSVSGVGIWAQLLAAPCFAASFLFTKVLSQRASSEEIVAMLTVFCTLALLPGAILVWKEPSTSELFWLTLTAIAATLGHYAMTQAMRHVQISMLQPFTFLQIVWATIMGIVLFSEAVKINVILGALLIVASTTYIAHRERSNA